MTSSNAKYLYIATRHLMQTYSTPTQKKSLEGDIYIIELNPNARVSTFMP